MSLRMACDILIAVPLKGSDIRCLPTSVCRSSDSSVEHISKTKQWTYSWYYRML